VLVGSNSPLGAIRSLFPAQSCATRRNAAPAIVAIDPPPDRDGRRKADLVSSHRARGPDTVLFCGLLVHLARAPRGSTGLTLKRNTTGFAENAGGGPREIAPRNAGRDRPASAAVAPRRHRPASSNLFRAAVRTVTGFFARAVNQSAQRHRQGQRPSSIATSPPGRIGRPGHGDRSR